MRRSAVLLFLIATSASGQDVPLAADGLPVGVETVEVQILRAVYGIESPLFAVPMEVINETSYPIFLASAPAAWAISGLAGADLDPALRLTLSQALSLGTTFALKRTVNRARPYVALGDMATRDRRYLREDVRDPYSFPSGHTSSAWVTATSLSLSYPEWYVIVPSAAWATGMGLTRMWHGVHYPTDVLAGAAIGIGSAVLVHVVLPDVFEEGEQGPAVPFRIRVAL
ncbi:MAG: phosphatase PAP2 family protein [Bacteroidota bacterium]